MVSKSNSATSSWSSFVKSILIPLSIALALYITIFILAIPLYRRYRTHIARYSAYAPLNSDLARSTTSLFAPIIEPSRTLWSRIMQKVRWTLWRAAVPGISAMNFDRLPREGEWEEMEGAGDGRATNGTGLSSDTSDDEAGLFDVETGRSMVGFDVRDVNGDARGYGLENQAVGTPNRERKRVEGRLARDERERSFAREMAGGRVRAEIMGASTVGGNGFGGEIDSGRRLSRELEGAFGDESDDEGGGGTREVVAGLRR